MTFKQKAVLLKMPEHGGSVNLRAGFCDDLITQKTFVSQRQICFVSRHDRVRGPICAAVFNHLASKLEVRALSAGIDAAAGFPVDTLTSEALKERGILSNERFILTERFDKRFAGTCERLIGVDKEITRRAMTACPSAVLRLSSMIEDVLPPKRYEISEYFLLIDKVQALLKMMFVF
ncbi:MAG: hypothetical protein ACOX4O_00110 [Eubacteriales bacterium]|jgi:protein-tyrosine-phosphatase